MRIRFAQLIIDILRGKKLYRKKINIKNKIVFIGDSHVNFFSGNEEISFVLIKDVSS